MTQNETRLGSHVLVADFRQKHELPAALKRYEDKQAGFVPVILQRCSWKQYVGEIQGLPSGGKPVSDWRPFDNAGFDVEEALRKTIVEVRKLLRRI